MEILTGILSTAFLAGGVLSLAALGEVISERVGVVNLGLEGLVALGAVTAIAVTMSVPNPYIGFAAALGIGLIFGIVFALATVIVRADQILCGLAFTMIGTGIAATVGRPFSGIPGAVTFEPVVVPYLSDIPIIGPAFFSQNILVYFIFLVLPFGVHFLLFKTRHGLNMRAVGENPAAADAAGIPVAAIRFVYVSIGSMFAAGAGAYLTLAFVPSWSDGIVAGRGWIAVALVIFARYSPWRAVLAGLLFGLITAVGFVGQALNWPISAPILGMLPYLGTISLIIVPAFIWRNKRYRSAAPEALGQAYYRSVR
ncbi:nucleoside ABC transporter membrane protein [Salinihabitans flavidus]|uniref:Nucleoside ABC transporter membrane protein n=1 Tax=Salinihabitans flavidus TaxID=569882 RepID=A0A1H8W4I6_9RHOB|nr:ABC transporter permease [Salinihabitans flavidus]SEP22561.1 nucleoside ABC transporter membrane protein [Salinihabitans flavidus]